MSRCTGHCCKKFWLGYSHEEMKIRYKKALAARAKGEATNIDFIKVYPMLIPLGKADGDGYLFTCKHHDAVTGDCKNYERRPKLCSEYPYGKMCNFKGCTMDQTETAAKLVQLRTEVAAMTTGLTDIKSKFDESKQVESAEANL